jgi:aminoglycoside 6'-N-acetyltransferase I
VFVADEGGVIGVVSYEVVTAIQHPAPLGRILFLTTARPARRRGIGGKLLAEAEARLRTLGCGTIEVVSAIELSNANSFLRAHGFARSGYRFTREAKRK